MIYMTGKKICCCSGLGFARTRLAVAFTSGVQMEQPIVSAHAELVSGEERVIAFLHDS